MGCDIHGIFQAKKDGAWVDVTSTYEFDRHYQLFAVLAGVRNGSGFAGVKTGEAVRPIFSPRGMPEDFQLDADKEVHPVSGFEFHAPWRHKYYEPGEGVWMGDHSHSWLSGDEMLSWFNAAPTVLQTGVIDRESYQKWDKGVPENYSGGIWGRNVVVVDASEAETTENYTHVQVVWKSSLAKELAYFFDEVKRLVDSHGEVRFVFGFDS